MRAEPTESANNSHSGWVRPEERLARWGLRQHRQVTTALLRAVGWDAGDVGYRVRHGRLHPVFAEVYSLGGPPRSDREWWTAAVLTYGDGTRLSDAPAAELYGWIRCSLGELHVSTTTERRPRDGITPHYRAGSTAWRYVDDIPVTAPEQTILDCAATIRSDKLLRRIVRIAQAEKMTTHARLLLLSARSAGVRGVARLRAELAAGPAPTRSANEDEAFALLRAPGRVLANHDIEGDEVDLYLPGHGVVIEVDSELHDTRPRGGTTRRRPRGSRRAACACTGCARASARPHGRRGARSWTARARRRARRPR